MQCAYFLSKTLKNTFQVKHKTNNFSPISAQKRTLKKISKGLARDMHMNYCQGFMFKKNRGEQSKNYGSIPLLCQECK